MGHGLMPMWSVLCVMLWAAPGGGSGAAADETASAVESLVGLDIIQFESMAGPKWLAEFEADGGAVGGPEELSGLLAGEPVIEADEELADNIVFFGDGAPQPYLFGYNTVTSAITWLPGHDDRFGWFSYESFGRSIAINDWPELATGFGVHFLDGPAQTDMPPRLFDFLIGLQDRRLIQPNIGYDVVFRVGAFSDFEGTAEKGVRYPSHAVTFWRLNPGWELVLGIDYLDRDDVSLLPVAGFIWRPTDFARVEAVFPRPRLAVQVMDWSQWIYLAGELGGGTWAIERAASAADDNATYRDIRLALGHEAQLGDAVTTAMEVAYVFARDLSYRSGSGDYEPADGWMVRWMTRH